MTGEDDSDGWSPLWSVATPVEHGKAADVERMKDMRRDRYLPIVFVLVTIMVLSSGCGVVGPGEVKGVVVDSDTGSRLSGVNVWLMLVLEGGAEASMHVLVDGNRAVPVDNPEIHTATAGNGEFIMEEVPPGEYILMGGGPYVLKDGEGKTVMLDLSGGEKLDMGEVSVQR